jgi:hypothetical protein
LNTKFSFEVVKNWNTWDTCVNRSEQGSIFFLSVYLQNSGVPSCCWFIYKGTKVCAGLCVQESGDGKKTQLDDLIIHNGLWFLPDPDHKETKVRHEQFEITEASIELLTKKYCKIELSLSPQSQDLRPYLWYNYNEHDSKQFNINLRYTNYQNIQELTEPKPYTEYKLFQDMETLRKRNLREAYKKQARLVISNNVDILLTNYRIMIEETGSVIDDKLSRMKVIMQALSNHNMGVQYDVLDVNDNCIYSVYFAWDDKRAYYLFGSGVTQSKERFQGTFAFWGAMCDLAQSRGIIEFDWEGVNSPKRGWFKLSFGGTLQPYYELNLKV